MMVGGTVLVKSVPIPIGRLFPGQALGLLLESGLEFSWM